MSVVPDLAGGSSTSDALLWLPVVLLLLQALTVVIVPLPALTVSVFSVTLFGPWVGFGITLLGTVAGSMLAFVLGRRFGWEAIRRMFRRAATRSRAELRNSAGWWLIPALWLPVPAGGDLACFLAGVCPLRLRRALLLVTIGRIPGSGLSVLTVTGLATGSTVVVAAVAVGLAGCLLAWHRWPGLSPSGRRFAARGTVSNER